MATNQEEPAPTEGRHEANGDWKKEGQTEGKNKETELLTKINKLTEDVDAKNKTSTTKLE